MKSIFSRVMAVVALTMSLGFAAGSANAALYSIGAWSGSDATGWTATYGNSVGTSGSFTDWVSFSLPGNANNGNANAVGNKVKISSWVDNVNFTLFNIYESTDAWATSILRGTGSVGVGGADVEFAGGATPGFYRIAVAGSIINSGKVGSYGGTITAAVPEPETYAMLLAGLGLLGLSTRRRNSSV